MTAVKRKTAALIAEIDEAELAVRILEAFLWIKRPPGTTAEQALKTGHITTCNGARNAALAAMKYITECVNRGSQPS